MFGKIKRVVAGILSSAMILSCAGCNIGEDTAIALTVDGYEIKAGVYIWYSLNSLEEAKNKAAGLNENLNVEDEKALKAVKLDGMEFMNYVKDQTTDECIQHVTILRQFDELGLSFTKHEQDDIDDYVDNYWDAYGDSLTKNGVGKESLYEIQEMTYKAEKVFESYYGEGGSEGITEDEVKKYYIENNARVRYIDIDLHDTEGNDLDEAGKEELRDMAEDFKKRAERVSDELEMLELFNEFQEEYDDFVLGETMEAGGEEDFVEATTEEATEAETEAVTEADSEVTEDATEDTTDVAAEEVTEAEEDSQASEEESAVTTVAEEGTEEIVTTTTTSPYTNEVIVSKVTTSEDTAEDEVNYTPSKSSYDWIFADTTKNMVPEIIEDEDTIYVIVKFDIEERMTEEDLWSESAADNVRWSMFYEEFEDKIQNIAETLEVVKNEDAYDRYDPFNIDME